MNLIRVNFSPVRSIKNNDQISVEDLILIRQSYGLSREEVQFFTLRYTKELAEKSTRIFFVEYDTLNAPMACAQLVLQSPGKDLSLDQDLANGLNIAHVHDLRVKNELQGLGHGKKLMLSLEKAARDRGLSLLTLAVDHWNLRAIQFYKSLGYEKFRSRSQASGELVYFMRKVV